MQTMIWLFSVGAITLLGGGLQDLPAQAPHCPPCEFRLSKVVELSSRAGVYTPSMASMLARFANGSYVLSPLAVNPHLVLFGPDGQLLTSYDKAGSGPGEFESGPWPFVGPGDTLYAVDRQRLLRFDSDLNPLNTRRMDLPVRSGLAFLSEGRMVTDGRHRLNPTMVSPVSILDSNGIILRSLEPIEVQHGVGVTLLTEHSGGGFWLMHSNDSEIRRRSSEGELEASVEVQREWFQEWTEFLPGEGITVPPRPYNSSISEISPGRLLITTWVPEEGWEPISSDGSFRPTEINWSDYYDTIIEAVDARTGEVLAFSREEKALYLVRGTLDHFHSVREEDDGHIAQEIWKVALVSGRERLRSQCGM